MRWFAWAVTTPLRWMLLGAVHTYRATLGPLLAGRCRFYPSCSSYAVRAIRVHGAFKGSALAVWRVLRCSPLTPGGVEPVPEQGTWRSRSVV